MTEERNRPELDGEVDSLVTRTYKEVASEPAPEHLDKAVLKQAADAARPRYLKSISWTRPMAWAATIILCVGLVLEITKEPPPPTRAETASPPGRIEAPASTLSKPEMVPVKARAPRSLMEEGQAPMERKRAGKMSADFRQQATVTPADAEVFSVADAPQALSACSDAEIAKPESWLLCIERLEDAGRTVEANEQRALYEAAFPADELH
ncbi:MAG: hypothetical protein GWP02_00130 [Desulfobulbaceae bacterium]|nr:hypothetical protein [Desulfobulbaceae bacterium]